MKRHIAVLWALFNIGLAYPAMAQNFTAATNMETDADTAHSEDNGSLEDGVLQIEAHQLFEEAVLLFQEKRLLEAGRKFREAYNTLPSWKLLYNIGQCEAGVKNYGAAIKAFEKYLLLGGDDIGIMRQDEVLAELDRLKRMVGKIVVEGPEGYEVFVNGASAGPSPVVSGVVVNIGMTHNVTVVDNATGEEINRFEVSVSGGETLRIQMQQPQSSDVSEQLSQPADDQAVPSVPTKTEATASPSVLPKKTSQKIDPALFFSALSTTVVAGGTTLGLALAIDSKWKSARADFESDPWGYDTSRNDNIRALQITSYLTGGLAAVALIATIVSIPFTKWKNKPPPGARLKMVPYASGSETGLFIMRSL